MSYQQDWLLRQIESLIQFAVTVILKKDSADYTRHGIEKLTAADLLHNKIQKMIARQDYCQAENYLFKNLDPTDPQGLEVAVDFYNTLNQIPDAQLEENYFSREEIQQGLDDILRRYNIETLPK